MSEERQALNDGDIKEIKRAYSAIKAFQEEKKSIAEDIREEKLQCSKKIGLPVKFINGIMKTLVARESGDYDDNYIEIAKQVESIMTDNSRPVNLSD